MNKVTLMVDELLNAGCASEGQLQLKKTTFNLSKAIDECCLHVTATGIHHLIIEGDKDVAVEADPERIQRVIVNFVNNAVKYATNSKSITIRVDRGPAHMRVSIIDQGPGIALGKDPAFI